MKEKVLILNGSFCELPLILEAKNMGYYVITTGNMPDLIGHQAADQYICADYSDKQAILQMVRQEGIAHIISCANDFGVLTAAYVAEQMGWRGHDTYQTAQMLHLKDRFKDYLQSHNIPCPHSVTFADKAAARAYAETVKYPIIVKATDLTGGKGILRADTLDQALLAIEHAFGASRSKRIVIEPFITGVQQSFVAFLVGQKVVSYTSNNSYSPINPYLIQSETLPAEEIEDIRGALCEIIEGMAADLQLVDGIFAFQFIRQGKEFYIIEMMRRPFGNQFLQLAEDNTTFPWHKAQLLTQLGKDCRGLAPIPQKRKFCGHHGVMAPKNGTILSYHIPAEIEKHIYKKIEMFHPGDAITNCLNQRVAYLYYEYDNLDEMNAAVRTFHTAITVEMQ